MTHPLNLFQSETQKTFWYGTAWNHTAKTLISNRDQVTGYPYFTLHTNIVSEICREVFETHKNAHKLPVRSV